MPVAALQKEFTRSRLARLGGTAYFLRVAALVLFLQLLALIPNGGRTYIERASGAVCHQTRIVAGTVAKPLICAAFDLRLNSSVDDVAALFPFSDPGSYIRGARQILNGEDPRRNPLTADWVPGMMVVDALLIALSPTHFVLLLFLVTITCWAASMAACAVLVRHLCGDPLLPLAIAGCIAFAMFRNYLFRSGIVMSEPLSIAAFLPAVLLICSSLQDQSIGQAASAALLLLIASLIRAQFLPVCECILGLLVVYGVIVTVHARLTVQTGRNFAWRPLLILIALYGGMLTVYASTNGGSIVHNEDLFAMPWRHFPSPPDFIELGGGRVLCDVDLATCERMHQVMAGGLDTQASRSADIHVIATRLPQVLARKLGYFVEYFFAEPSYLGWGVYGFAYVENTVFALMALLALTACASWRRDPLFAALGLIQLGSWAGSLAASMLIVQFETRYFFVGKAVAFLAFVTVAARWSAARYLPPQSQSRKAIAA